MQGENPSSQDLLESLSKTSKKIFNKINEIAKSTKEEDLMARPPSGKAKPFR